MLAVIGLMLASAAAVPAVAADAARPAVRIEINLEPGVTIEPSDLRAAAADIERIWAPVLDLAITVGSGASRLWGINAIPLVITNRTLDSHEKTGLGWIAFADGEPQIPITVSVTAIRRIVEAGTWQGTKLARMPARASRVFVQRALARAAAHEIGHYLLRSPAHARRGLMRPAFTAQEIMDGRPSLDRLDPADVAKLRSNAALLVRNEPIADR
jgi:hypothetical protein